MAELSISRNRRAVPKVDLTAMVDLAFLLITFFMLSTSLSKPVAMDIVKPDEPIDDVDFIDIPASRSMTILLGKDDKVAWYMGEPGESVPVIESMNTVRQSILGNKRKVDAIAKDSRRNGLIVIVKPTAGAKFENFVDIMDELSLSDLKLAPAIDDDHILDFERDFMLKNKI